MGLAMLSGYAAVMFLIGIADGRQSGYVFGVTDALVLSRRRGARGLQAREGEDEA